jgi:hypothetical protein
VVLEPGQRRAEAVGEGHVLDGADGVPGPAQRDRGGVVEVGAADAVARREALAELDQRGGRVVVLEHPHQCPQAARGKGVVRREAEVLHRRVELGLQAGEVVALRPVRGA